MTVPALLRAAAAALGERVALTVEDAGSLSYAEWERRSSALARGLVARGVAPGDRVALRFAETDAVDYAVAYLGILKAAAVAAPLQHRLVRSEVEGLLARAGAAGLVCSEPSVSHAGWTAAPAELERPERDAAAEREPAPGDTAHVLATAGTTGSPKLVAATHANLTFGYDPDRGFEPDGACFVHAFPLATNAGQAVLLSPLFNGIAAIFLPAFDPERLCALVEERRARSTGLVPAAAVALLDSGALERHDLSSLREVVLTAAASPPAVLRRLAEALPDAEIRNAYSTTEAAPARTEMRWDPARPDSVGRPPDGSGVAVLDEQGRPLPARRIGALALRSPAAPRRYLGDDDATAETFAGGWTRTGDLGYLDAEGYVYLVDRADDLVKTGGFGVSSLEIEAALHEHPAVAGAAAVGVPHPTLGQVPACAVVLRSETPVAELRAFLRARLADYKVPRRIVPLEELPRNPLGKVDKRALRRELESSRPRFEPPRTKTEERLATLWAALLGVERAGGDDDFFDLGGHSLLATQLASRTGEAFGVELPLRLVFDHPTLGELARAVDEAVSAERPFLVPSVEPAPAGDGGQPLSSAQEGLWFADQLEPGSPAYNLSLAASLLGPLDRAALERALGELLRRHESLRARFVAGADGRPLSLVEPDGGFRLPVEDVSGLEVRARAAEEAARPFELARGPLVRARLLALRPEEHVLLLTVHHIACDGWSLALFTRELAALYAAFRGGLPSPLPEPGLRYADHARRQRRSLEGGRAAGQLAYWRERLARLQELALPAGRTPGTARRSAPGGAVSFLLEPELSAALRALGQGAGATPFMTFLAAFALLLGRFAGQDDIAVGTPVAGRTRPELEDVVGMFVNMLVLRVDRGGDPSFAELVARARETALGALANQDVPFERLVAELAPARDPARHPLFQVGYTLERAGEVAELALDGLEVTPLELPVTTTQLDLELFLAERGGRLEGRFVYATERFDEATVARLAAHLRSLLEAVVEAPEAPLSQLDLLPPDERRLLVERWNETARPLPEETVPAAIARRARACPDATAVVCGPERLSYAELERRARRLAGRFRALGIGPESPVALRLPRGLDLVCCELAAWKAGAAFLPLDPDWPPERLELLVSDSGARLVVTPEWLAAETGEPETAPDVDVHPRSLAYVVYTSGSTGLPKAVAVEHRSLANAVLGWAAIYGDRPPRRLLSLASPAFDVAVGDLVRTLPFGSTLVLAEPEEGAEPELLEDVLRRERIEACELVPGALAVALERRLREHGRDLPELRLVVEGTGAWDAEARALVRRLSPEGRLGHVFGVTEATIDSLWWLFPAAAVPAEGPLPVGRPLPNTRAYLLESALRPVPLGAPGELYLGGAGVARGYLNRPAQTAERFLPDPFGPPGARLYRTGDVARYLPSGDVLFLGRRDDQVKIRGLRVELGEVEAALRGHPHVDDAAVVARAERLHAYVVPRGDAPSPGELRELLRRRLPEPMVPATFKTLGALPRTASGKVDRRALPEPGPEPELRFVPPRTPVESLLCSIWSEVLGLERVGVDDDFFDLGGHSLLATQMVVRARRALELELPLRLAFERPTVASLAAAVEEALVEEIRAAPAAAVPEGTPA